MSCFLSRIPLFAILRKSLETVCFHKENTDDDPETYAFMKKNARGARSPFVFNMRTIDKASYLK